jgi:hypothetical protein
VLKLPTLKRRAASPAAHIGNDQRSVIRENPDARTLPLLARYGLDQARRIERVLVVIGRSKTVLSPQPWSWPGPRVLIEHPDEAAGLALASSLRQAGFAVAICPGPEQADRCPLTGPEGCAAAHGADAVVSCLGLERPATREVVESLRRRCPGIPLIVEVAAGQEDTWHDLLEGCQVVSAPAGPEQLVSAVQQALARPRREE